MTSLGDCSEGNFIFIRGGDATFNFLFNFSFNSILGMENKSSLSAALCCHGFVELDLTRSTSVLRSRPCLNFIRAETERDIQVGIVTAKGRMKPPGRMFHINAKDALKAGLFELLDEYGNSPKDLASPTKKARVSRTPQYPLALGAIDLPDHSRETGYSIYFDTPDPFWDENLRAEETYYLRLSTKKGTIRAQKRNRPSSAAPNQQIYADAQCIPIYRLHQCIQIRVKPKPRLRSLPPVFSATLEGPSRYDMAPGSKPFALTLTLENTHTTPITTFDVRGGGIIAPELCSKFKFVDVSSGKELDDPEEVSYCFEGVSELDHISPHFTEYMPKKRVSRTFYFHGRESDSQDITSLNLEEDHIYSIQLRQSEMPGWRYGRTAEVKERLQMEPESDWFKNRQGSIKVKVKPERLLFKAVAGAEPAEAKVERELARVAIAPKTRTDDETMVMKLGREHYETSSLIDFVKKPAPIFVASIDSSSDTLSLSAKPEPMILTIQWTNWSDKPVTLFRESPGLKRVSPSACFIFNDMQLQNETSYEIRTTPKYSMTKDRAPPASSFLTINPGERLSRVLEIGPERNGQDVFEKLDHGLYIVEPNFNVVDRFDKWIYGTVDEVARTPEQRKKAKDWDRTREPIWICWMETETCFTVRAT